MEVKKEWLDWLASGDTGMSSKTMLEYLTGIPTANRTVPSDLSDVGRCVRMLRTLPELRPLLHKVVEKDPSWIPFIDCWKELERKYDECIKWESTPKEEQKRLKRQKYFVVPNENFWELMQQLTFASHYLGGMRLQNSSSSWRNRPPETY